MRILFQIFISALLGISTLVNAESNVSPTTNRNSEFTVAVFDFVPLFKEDSTTARLISDTVAYYLDSLSLVNVQSRSETVTKCADYGTAFLVDTRDSINPVLAGHLLGAHFLITGTYARSSLASLVVMKLTSIISGEVLATITVECTESVSKLLTYEIPLSIGGFITAFSNETKKKDFSKAQSYLKVDVQPRFSHVYLNHDFIGAGNGVYTIPQGNALLELFAPGYKTLELSLSVKNGDTVVVNPDLEYSFAALEVFSNPPGARISINNSLLGYTPYKNLRFPTGEFLLNLSLKRFKEFEDQFSLAGREYRRITVQMKLTDEISDSISHENWHRNKFQKGRRFIFSVSTVLAGASMGAFYYLTSDAVENMHSAESDYDAAKNNFDAYKTDYADSREKAIRYQRGLIASSVVGGASFAALTISLFF